MFGLIYEAMVEHGIATKLWSILKAFGLPLQYLLIQRPNTTMDGHVGGEIFLCQAPDARPQIKVTTRNSQFTALGLLQQQTILNTDGMKKA